MMLTWTQTFARPSRIPAVWVVENGVLEPTATNFGVATSGDGARFEPGDYLTMPDTTLDVTLGTGDFTLGAEFTIHGTVPASGSAFTDFIFWSPFASGSQAMNYEFGYNHTAQQFHLSTSNSGNAALYRTFPFALALNTLYKVEMTREAGVLACWVNGTKIGESAFTVNIAHNVITPIKFGRRIGGTAGEVVWSSNMTLKNLYIAKVGRSSFY